MMSILHVEVSSDRPPKIFWPLLVIVIILAAEGAVALVLHTVATGWDDDNFFMFYLGAPASALLVGIPAWLRYVVIARHATLKRGLAIGIIGSILAHPVMWVLFFLASLPVFQVASWSPVLFLLEVLYSLIYGGWATTVMGALAGISLIWLQHALTRRGQERAERVAAMLRQRESSGLEMEAEGGARR